MEKYFLLLLLPYHWAWRRPCCLRCAWRGQSTPPVHAGRGRLQLDWAMSCNSIEPWGVNPTSYAVVGCLVEEIGGGRRRGSGRKRRGSGVGRVDWFFNIFYTKRGPPLWTSHCNKTYNFGQLTPDPPLDYRVPSPYTLALLEGMIVF
jgi:hypothetical protein